MPKATRARRMPESGFFIDLSPVGDYSPVLVADAGRGALCEMSRPLLSVRQVY